MNYYISGVWMEHWISYLHSLLTLNYGRQNLRQGLLEYYLKEGDNILNPLGAVFRGAYNQQWGVGIWPSTVGV